ncbi:MAG: osmotically inducible protein C [Fluviicola sp.]|nr:MAG: osmotically inducible protein C [Fluviicola sp.]
MRLTKIDFKNKQGNTISGRLDFPRDQKPLAYVLFAHCFTCNKNLIPVTNISRQLTEKGFAVFRFDFTGLGESEGDFEDTNFSSNIEDLLCAADFMEKEHEAPSLIVGHSLGGAAVIYAASKLESVQAVATIAAPSSPGHVKNLFKEDIEQIKEDGTAEVTISGRSFNINKQFIEDISGKNMHTILENMRKPLLILHSPQDNTVGVDNAAEIYKHAMHPKSFISLDGADHLLSDKKDSAYAGNVIATWSIRYLDLPERNTLPKKGQVTAQIGTEGFTTELRAGHHTFRADEPEEVGGNDFGPSPYDLILSGLGACTAMTLRMYADRKKWKLEEVDVYLDHSKDYAEDCKNPEEKKSKIDVMERKIVLKGDLDEKQRKRLLEIANKCPVHKTLHEKVEVRTSLED